MSRNQKKLVIDNINRPINNINKPNFILCIKKAKPVTKKNTPILEIKGQGLGETK